MGYDRRTGMCEECGAKAGEHGPECEFGSELIHQQLGIPFKSNRVNLFATVTLLGPYAAYRVGTNELVAYCERDGRVVCGVDGYGPVGHPPMYKVVSVSEKAWE